jgi:multiple sugar transport system permease protein
MTAIPTYNTSEEVKPPFLQRVSWGKVAAWSVMVLLILITLFPFLWVLRTALTGPRAVYDNPESLLPVDPTLSNFGRVLGLIDPSTLGDVTAGGQSIASLNFWLYLRNSFVVAIAVMLGQTVFSSMAAYAFARFHFPFRDELFAIYLTGLMVPGIVLFIPNFVLIRQIGWIGTFQGIIAPSFLMTPFAVFFMRQFFLGLNRELAESALLDGATPIGVFWRVALPLMRGPILTIALLTFIGTWNDYLWPLLVGRDDQVRVLTVALAVFREQTPQGAPDWSGLMAGTASAIVPTMLLFVFFGRRVVDSIQFSGFK